MSEGGPGRRPAERWQLREGLILAAYLALAAIGTLTVLLPELRDEPAAEQDGDGDRRDTPDAG